MEFLNIESDPLPPLTIWAVRKAMGLSQEGFGAKLGVTRRTIISWEKDQEDAHARNCTGPARLLIQHHARSVRKVEDETRVMLEGRGLLVS